MCADQNLAITRQALVTLSRPESCLVGNRHGGAVETLAKDRLDIGDEGSRIGFAQIDHVRVTLEVDQPILNGDPTVPGDDVSLRRKEEIGSRDGLGTPVDIP
jgi:hypothetical protein